MQPLNYASCCDTTVVRGCVWLLSNKSLCAQRQIPNLYCCLTKVCVLKGPILIPNVWCSLHVAGE